MKGTLKILALASVLVPLLCGARTLPASVSSGQLDELTRIEALNGRPIAAAFDERWGTPRWLSGRLGTVSRADASGGMSWLLAHRKLLRLDDPRLQLRFVEKRHSPGTGVDHLVYARQEGGITVWAAEIVLHVRPDGTVSDLTASYPPALPVVPGAFGPEPVMELAGEELGAIAADVAPRRPVRRVLIPHQGRLEMGWQFGLMWHAHQPRAFEVLASARDGRVLRRWSLIQDQVTHAEGSGTLPGGQSVKLNVGFFEQGNHYILYDAKRKLASGSAFVTYDGKNENDLGTLVSAVQQVVSSNGTFKDSAAVAAHYNLGLVYDYFKNTHGWESWNGQGGSIQSFVHVDHQLNNAYWHGGLEAMFFGDGDGQLFTQLATCLDVAGHELSHGVVGGTIGLVYENQSGALNEHFADFLGTMVDPPTGGSQDWWLGEDCMGSGFPTPFLRHIKDPGKAGQPGHGYDYQDLPNTADGDWGGVHINSGIPNKVSFLLATMLGVSTAEKVHFEILRGKYIGANASFLDFRNAWISACGSVVGGVACDNAQGAFDQVGILAQGSASDCGVGASSGGVFGCACPSGEPYNYTSGGCGGASSTSCGGVPASGVCDGSTLKKCVNGTVVSTSCPESCLWSPVFGSFQCAAAEACGSVGPGGECAGSQLKYCESGTLKVLDCAQYGKTCAAGDCVDIGSSSCTPVCNGACGSDGCGGSCGSCSAGEVCSGAQCTAWEAQECGAVTFEGQCDGQQLSYCDAGLLVEMDCVASGASCGFNSEQSYFDCLTTGPTACGAVTSEGQCAESVLSYCEGDSLQSYDCTAMGLSCGMNTSGNYYDCLTLDSQGCGDVTFKGYCSAAGAVVYCQDQQLQTLQCNLDFQECQYEISKLYYNCVKVGEAPPGAEEPVRDDGGLCSVQAHLDSVSSGTVGFALGLLALVLLVLGAIRLRPETR